MQHIIAHYEQLLAPEKELRPDGLEKIVVSLPADVCHVEENEKYEFRRQFFALVQEECSNPNPEWSKGAQGAPVRAFGGFPLVEKYLGKGSIWLRPSKWVKTLPEGWVVISPVGGSFAPGSTFKL